jgi:hypothetical protein
MMVYLVHFGPFLACLFVRSFSSFTFPGGIRNLFTGHRMRHVGLLWCSLDQLALQHRHQPAHPHALDNMHHVAGDIPYDIKHSQEC